MRCPVEEASRIGEQTYSDTFGPGFKRHTAGCMQIALKHIWQLDHPCIVDHLGVAAAESCLRQR